MFINKHLPLIGIFITLSAFSSYAKSNLKSEGRAYEPKSENLLYIEKHFRESNDIHTVVYYEADGQEFARKTLFLTDKSIAPLFEQTNNRLGEIIRVTATDNNKIDIYYKEESSSETQKSQVALSDRLVIDAGFDNLVRNNWDLLLSGESLTFSYLLPSWGKTVELAIKKSKCTNGSLCLAISASNPLFRLFSSEIELEYDLKTQNLNKFSGKGNIASASGRYQTVNIHYQHFNIQTEGLNL